MALKLLLCVVASNVHAQDRDKTDVIVIANGDRIQGEILSLAYGRLTLKTDSMGTVNIEWPDVRAVSSTYHFYVARTNGVQYYGTLASVDDTGFVVVRSAGGTTTRLPTTDVATIDQVEDSFWSRINASMSVGFNYTRSTEIGVSSVRIDTQYRSRRFIATLGFDGDRTTDPSEGVTERWDIDYNHQVLRSGSSFGFGSTSLERNEQLGIERRLQFAGGMGINVMQTFKSALTTYAGVAINQEWTTDEDDDSQRTIEGVLGADWRIFRFQEPETSLASSIVVYPGITESGRYRATMDVSLRREMIDDLYLDLSFYGAYDNRPPSTADKTTSSDYGVVTSVGYSF